MRQLRRLRQLRQLLSLQERMSRQRNVMTTKRRVLDVQRDSQRDFKKWPPEAVTPQLASLFNSFSEILSSYHIMRHHSVAMAPLPRRRGDAMAISVAKTSDLPLDLMFDRTLDRIFDGMFDGTFNGTFHRSNVRLNFPSIVRSNVFP